MFDTVYSCHEADVNLFFLSFNVLGRLLSLSFRALNSALIPAVMSGSEKCHVSLFNCYVTWELAIGPPWPSKR